MDPVPQTIQLNEANCKTPCSLLKEPSFLQGSMFISSTVVWDINFSRLEEQKISYGKLAIATQSESFPPFTCHNLHPTEMFIFTEPTVPSNNTQYQRDSAWSVRKPKQDLYHLSLTF